MEAHPWGVAAGFRDFLLRIREVFLHAHLGCFHEFLFDGAFGLVLGELTSQGGDFRPEECVGCFGLAQLLSEVLVFATEHGFGSRVHLHFKTL